MMAGVTSEAGPLQDEVQGLLAQAAGVQACRDWMLRRDAFQTQYDSAEKARKFSDAARLGKALVAADAEAAQLALSMEQFKTLHDRYKQLVARLEAECLSKMQAEDFDGLEPLSQLPETFQALPL